ncbi:ABC transporter permease [Paenibacillus sp. GCM10027627]|uniref:ABC transporter permease n=1 Tax=unclassified Paenibacillus TaxID=185978 RepID=UPI003641DEDA
MKFGDQLRFVRQNMKKNKTRLFMTVLATAMGCAFLIVLASVGFGLQQSIVNNIVGDRLVTGIDVNGKHPDKFKEPDIFGEDIATFREMPNVKAVTYRNYIQQRLGATIGVADVNNDSTLAVDFEAEGRAGFSLSAGRLPESENEVVLGYQIRQSVDEHGIPGEWRDASEWLNQTMTLNVAYYKAGKKETKLIEVKVVGITEKPAKEWELDRTLYIGEGFLGTIEGVTGTQNGDLPQFEVDPTVEQVEAAMKQMPKPGGKRSYKQVQVIADHASNVKGIGEALREKGYYNYSIADELKQVNLMFAIMKIGLIFVGTIAVLIASIGIFNTMTMAVTERAQDIGIMKAIGAHPSVIRKIFLLESAIIGVLGAFVGTAAAYAISMAVNAGLPLLLEKTMGEEVPAGFLFSVIPLYLAALSCAIALGVAVLSGYRPAKRATRIDVLSALRRDL